MLRLAIAQVRPRKADYRGNLRALGDRFRSLAGAAEAPDLLVLPETALTGYFLEGGVQEVAMTADALYGDLARVHRDSGAPPLEVMVGFYEVWQNRLHNSVLAAALGGADAGIRHVHRKVFLPTYGVFDEERFVEAGQEVRAFDTRWGRGALLICEDAWHSLTPTLAALGGAELMVILSASPARGAAPQEVTVRQPANVARWERIARD